MLDGRNVLKVLAGGLEREMRGSRGEPRPNVWGGLSLLT